MSNTNNNNDHGKRFENIAKHLIDQYVWLQTIQNMFRVNKNTSHTSTRTRRLVRDDPADNRASPRANPPANPPANEPANALEEEDAGVDFFPLVMMLILGAMIYILLTNTYSVLITLTLYGCYSVKTSMDALREQQQQLTAQLELLKQAHNDWRKCIPHNTIVLAKNL